MIAGLLDSLRFARGWSSPRKDLLEREVVLPVEAGSVPGTLLEPPGQAPRPGWVVLHGLTRPGRQHASLRRFASAAASTGIRVLIPEIREWRELRMASERAQLILRSGVRWLAEDPRTAGPRVFLVGFSFGGPQALRAAADPEVASRLRAVLAWGSYADFQGTLGFQFTGEHLYTGPGEPRYRGVRYRTPPDPYGRWIVGANCLRYIPRYRDAGDVAEALWALAARAGDLQIPADDPSLEPLKAELREGVAEERRELFDLFAPPRRAGEPPIPPEEDRDRALELADALAKATSREAPLLDPVTGMGTISVPVRLLHGRGDALIPFTETLILADALRPRTRDLKVGITGLFAHSGGSGDSAGLWARTRENLHFLRVLRRVFEVE